MSDFGQLGQPQFFPGPFGMPLQGQYLLLPPDQNVFGQRSVSVTAGTVDTDAGASWLTDLRPAFPMRINSNTWGASISVANAAVQLIVLANHSLDSSVTLAGSVSGTLVIPPARPNGIRKNPFIYYPSPIVGVTSVTFNGTNIVATVIIGEALAGVPLTIPAFQMKDMHDEFFDGATDLQGDFMNVPSHDKGYEWRVYGGTQVFTDTDKDNIIACWEAQRGGSQPTVLVTDVNSNDARVVQLGRPTFKQFESSAYWESTLVFVEYPRYRWIS